MEEVVDLVVLGDGALRVLRGAALRPDQVIAVHGARHRGLLLACLHELEERHLARGVLERHAVHAQAELRLAPTPLLLVEIVGVSDQDLLAEGQGPAEALAGPVQLGGHGFVEPLDLVYRHGGPSSMTKVSEMTTAHTHIASHPAGQEATGEI